MATTTRVVADLYLEQVEAVWPLKLSGAAVSKATGVSENTISQWRAGKRGINTRKATAIYEFVYGKKLAADLEE
jgi:hypothetical protein